MARYRRPLQGLTFSHLQRLRDRRNILPCASRVDSRRIADDAAGCLDDTRNVPHYDTREPARHARRAVAAPLCDTQDRPDMTTSRTARIALALVFAWSLPTHCLAEGRVHEEGIFKVSLPPAWTRMPQEMLDEVKRNMVGGARELARASKSGNPGDYSHEAVPFLSGFQLRDGKTGILLMFIGVSTPIPMTREEMYARNQERVKWGIETGRLAAGSKGVSRLDLDGVPSLLQDIEISDGSRMQVYSLFVSEHPRMQYVISVTSDDTATHHRHADELASIIKSLKVTRQPAERMP
jgi:hypothetical protein